MILRIGFIALNLLAVTLVAENVASSKQSRSKRQSNYQYVNFELPNSTNFQFTPSHDPSQFGHFQNQFQNFNPRPAADQFNTNSIRRFPQFPNAAPANEEPLISVLSGSNQFHPSQSVSWNPPSTIVPPQQVSNSRTSAQSRSIDQSPSQNQFFKPEPEASPVAPKPNFHLEDSIPNKRVNLQAGNSLVDKPSAAIPSTTPSPATTAKDGKKDDVVIYYYYYYDDDKNKTKGGGEEGLDTIPSLEGFDAPKAKPGKVIIKNENYAPKEVAQPIIPLRVDSRMPNQNVPLSAPASPQQPFNRLSEQPQYSVPTTERPTTQSLRTTPLDNQGLISNIFRYGSSSVAPNVPSTSEPRPFTPEAPLDSYEPMKVSETPKTLSSESINKLPNFTPDKESPENVFADLNTTPMQTLSPSTIRTTLSTTTTTTTTTTTPAPTTTTTTTTTTTPAPVEETEAPGRRPSGRFGNRRPGIGAGRPNPLNRLRSTTSTTTTPAPSTTERTRSFTRPSPVSPQRTRQNRFRKRPGFGGDSEDTNSDSAPSASSTSTTEAPSRSETSSTASPRGRFGGRSRFSANRQQGSSTAAQTQASSTTPAPSSTENPNSVSTTRRAFNSRGRPQLRGGGGRASFQRNRTKPNAPPADEVTPDPSEASTPGNETSSSAAAAPSSEKPNEPVTESSASSEGTPDGSATEASSTEKPKGRQRPLFGARPRPNLFGRRGSPAGQ